MTQFRALFLIALVALGSTSAEAVKVKAHARAHSGQRGSKGGDVKDAKETRKGEVTQTQYQ